MFVRYLSFLLFLTILLLAFLPCTYARKYDAWFYWYDRPGDGTLSNLSQGLCSPQLYGYRNASALDTVYKGQGVVQWCYDVEDYILDAMRPSYLQNYQAGNVILGIMPTLLALVGPRVAEISLLSTHRPFLSFLLSVGAPGVWPTRVFLYDDPAKCLRRGLFSLTPQSTARSRWISATQYILAVGAIVNLLQTAIMLGRLTVISWSCNFDYGPLAWSLIPLAIHGIAAVSYNIEIARTVRRVRVQSSSEQSAEPSSKVLVTFLEKRANMKWWEKEFSLCANQPHGLEALLKQKKMYPLAVLLNCVASLMAFFHLLLGTMLFSSMVFIAVWDIMNSVLWRYLLSTVVCRLILLVELAGIREEGRQDIDELAVKVDGLEKKLNGMDG